MEGSVTRFGNNSGGNMPSFVPVQWTQGHFVMPRKYRFPRQAYVRVKRAAHRADVRELCYLLFGKGGTIDRVIQVPNRAVDDVCHHVFGTADFERVRLKMKKLGYKHIGYLHTHPVSEPVPGPGDVAGYAKGALVSIYADRTKELRLFRITKKGKGYVEKQLEFG